MKINSNWEGYEMDVGGWATRSVAHLMRLLRVLTCLAFRGVVWQNGVGLKTGPVGPTGALDPALLVWAYTG